MVNPLKVDRESEKRSYITWLEYWFTAAWAHTIVESTASIAVPRQDWLSLADVVSQSLLWIALTQELAVVLTFITAWKKRPFFYNITMSTYQPVAEKWVIHTDLGEIEANFFKQWHGRSTRWNHRNPVSSKSKGTSSSRRPYSKASLGGFPHCVLGALHLLGDDSTMA